MSIVHRGIAYPLVWTALDKAGNSDTEERITVLEIFLDLFGKEQIAYLVADREFVRRQWLRWLRQQGIKFHLRVHANYLVANGRGKLVHAYKLFRATRVQQPFVIPPARRMWGDDWYFSDCYLGSGEYLILVSPSLSEDAVTQYIAPLPHGGGAAAKLTEERLETLYELVAQTPDAKLEEFAQQLFQETGISVSESTICCGLQKLELTLKKDQTRQRS